MHSKQRRICPVRPAETHLDPHFAALESHESWKSYELVQIESPDYTSVVDTKEHEGLQAQAAVWKKALK